MKALDKEKKINESEPSNDSDSHSFGDNEESLSVKQKNAMSNSIPS